MHTCLYTCTQQVHGLCIFEWRWSRGKRTQAKLKKGTINLILSNVQSPAAEEWKPCIHFHLKAKPTSTCCLETRLLFQFWTKSFGSFPDMGLNKKPGCRIYYSSFHNLFKQDLDSDFFFLSVFVVLLLLLFFPQIQTVTENIMEFPASSQEFPTLLLGVDWFDVVSSLPPTLSEASFWIF